MIPCYIALLKKCSKTTRKFAIKLYQNHGKFAPLYRLGFGSTFFQKVVWFWFNLFSKGCFSKGWFR